MIKTIRILAAAGLCALALAACNTTGPSGALNAGLTKVDNAIASADLKFRDKCAYAVSGLKIAQIGAAIFVPNASALADEGAALVKDYCEGGPVTNVSAVMQILERFIVRARSVAAQVE